MDKRNLCAQNLNAKELLKNNKSNIFDIETINYYSPIDEVKNNKKILIHQLKKGKFWYLHNIFLYLRKNEIIFMPDFHITDYIGIRLRRLLRIKTILITSFELLIGDENDKKLFEDIAGHNIFFQKVSGFEKYINNYFYKSSNHIIAISPLLKKIGGIMYGDKFSFLPLGINKNYFYPNKFVKKSLKKTKLKIICAAKMEKRKNPSIFLKLAKLYPYHDFVWYGDGKLREKYLKLLQDKNIRNLYFPGNLSPTELGNEFRSGDIFILPSFAEGVPKASQEAAACGLPILLFGYYEPFSVIENYNGFLAWNLDEFNLNLKKLIENPELRNNMSKNSIALSENWYWDKLAEKWFNKVEEIYHNTKK